MKLFPLQYVKHQNFAFKDVQVFLLLLAFLASLCGCTATATTGRGRENVALLSKWNGDFPVSQLDRLPAGRQDSAVGYINDMETFLPIWRIFKPKEMLPPVDFKTNFVVLVRNTQFYNNLIILKIIREGNTAEIAVLETMSTRPIDEMVSLAMAVVPRHKITAIKAGKHKVDVLNNYNVRSFQ